MRLVQGLDDDDDVEPEADDFLARLDGGVYRGEMQEEVEIHTTSIEMYVDGGSPAREDDTVEWRTIEGCGGFYGDDHEKSGLIHTLWGGESEGSSK